jgi:predicted dehydrogenase
MRAGRNLFMRITWGKKVYALPDPVPGRGERAVRIRERFIFPQPGNRCGSRFEFPHRWVKLLFFLRTEGLRLTLRKVLASRLQVSLIRARRVVFAAGEDLSGAQVVALGPMDCTDSDFMVAPADWCHDLPQHLSPSACLEIVATHLRSRPEALDEIFDYSPFSGKELHFSLTRLLESAGPAVQASGGGATLSPLQLNAGRLCVLTSKNRPMAPDLFVAGAGAYVHSYVLPCLRGLSMHTVVDLNAALAARTAERFGFRHADTSCARAFERLADCRMPVLVIATYHSTHVELAKLAWDINPSTRILIEKPPVTDMGQLRRLASLRERGAWIEIGYNRRHARLARKLGQGLRQAHGPIHMTCIVKELRIPPSHWYHWPAQGTRITGNLCHWLDLAAFLIGSLPVRVRAECDSRHALGDELTVMAHYEDGSRLTLVATEQGNSLAGVQEYIDVRRGDFTGIIDDFVRLKVLDGGSRRTSRTFSRTKGHREMYRDFVQRITAGRPPYTSQTDLVSSSAAYLAALESCRSGCAMGLSFDAQGGVRIDPLSYGR